MAPRPIRSQSRKTARAPTLASLCQSVSFHLSVPSTFSLPIRLSLCCTPPPLPPPPPNPQTPQHLALLEITGFPLTPPWRYNPFISVYKYISAELLEAPCLFPPLRLPTASAALSHEMYCMCAFKGGTLRAKK